MKQCKKSLDDSAEFRAYSRNEWIKNIGHALLSLVGICVTILCFAALAFFVLIITSSF